MPGGRQQNPSKRTSNERQRQLVNLGLVPDLDHEHGAQSEEDNDEDLEAELQSLMFAGSKASKPQKRKTASNPTPQVDLEAMVAACMADDISDTDDAEEDPELLDELAEFAQEEKEEQVHDNQDDLGCAGESLLTVIDERIKMYISAEKKAKAAGESSRARRFARGLATLSDQRKKLKDGKAINENDIPPVISSGAIKSEAPLQLAQDHEQEPRHRPLPKPVADKQPTINDKHSELMKELQEKRVRYREVALNAKKDGDKSRATLGLQGVKQCDELLLRLQKGQIEAADLASLPSLTPPPLGRTFSRDDPIDLPENPEDIPPVDPKVFGAPPAANTIEEALRQRLAKYKSDEAKAKEEENSSRVRRLGRICKQYEEAIKLNKKGKLGSAIINELPCPPGFGPVPLSAPAAMPATTPMASPGLPVASESTTVHNASSPVVAKAKVNKPMSLQEKQLAELQKRQMQFKKAALGAKKAGQTGEAKEYLRQAKGFDKLIEAAKSGLPVDFKTLPVAPQQLLKDVVMDFEIVSTEDCNIGSDAVAAGLDSHHPKQRQEMYVKLEQDLLSQIKMCQANRLYFKSTGEVASMNKFQQMEEHTKKDLDSLRFAFKRGDAVPKFHYEVRAFSKVVICPDLTDNELEFSVQQGINLNVAKDAHTYCRIEFPYPKETPFKEKTGVVKDSNSPEYNYSIKIPLNIKDKSCQRVFKRSNAKVEVWNKVGFLRSDVCVGSIGVKLQPLESQCILHETFPLMDGRRAVGGQLEIKIRLRNPVVTKQIEKVEEKWLIISF